MHLDGLIFDLDGTLWDCSQASTDAFNRTYEEFGVNRRVTKEFVESISRTPTSECDEILLAEVPIELREKVLRCLDDSEIAAVQRYASIALYPDVRRGLEMLKLRYKCFMVSNCSERYLQIFHRHTPIGNIFVDSECFGRTRNLKHENIKAIIDRQNLSSPCYIGDTAGDEDAATRAGVPFFHASYGFGKPIGNPVAFASFSDLTKYFEKLWD